MHGMTRSLLHILHWIEETSEILYYLDKMIADEISEIYENLKEDNTDTLLYSGQFGAVYEARLSKDERTSDDSINEYRPETDERVAVKTLKGMSK